jgi:hypothetical protein
MEAKMGEEPLEEKLEKKKEVKVKNTDEMLFGKIEPDKWYGICYGRDLEKECGKFYQ